MSTMAVKIAIWFTTFPGAGYFSRVNWLMPFPKVSDLIERVQDIKMEFFSFMKCSREMRSRD